MKAISILFLILFYYSHPQLSDEERNNLLKKVTKLISIESFFHPLTSAEDEDSEKITYKTSKIKEIIQGHNFPSSYNYIEDEGITPIIKNQGSCGACWAFASTTALAYRFHKLGKNVDLSPQFPISCYNRDCNSGDYLIDSEFNLVKNGTVTDSCMPYTSSSGKNYEIDKCPNKCNNGNDFEKFYSKSAYTTLYDLIQENYYDIVTVIMDQLIKYGPVQSGIDIYEDFYSLNNKQKCENVIYKYDGVSEKEGGHAVVIVGYGEENDKYYWIIQNSWGAGFCDNGFAKIEFGEIGIETVAFSQPYIEEGSPSKDISITFTKINNLCQFLFTSSNSENNFEMFFNNNDLNIYFQCGSNPKSDSEGICSISLRSIFNKKGVYKFSGYNALLNQDKYTLNFPSGSLKEFQFYGGDTVTTYSDIYISESGSIITLPFVPLDEENEENNDFPKIYPNENVNTPLSDCRIEDFVEFKVIVCTIKSNELSYFSSSNNLPLVYNFLCGKNEVGNVSLLDKKKYPVFRIKQFIIDTSQTSGNSNTTRTYLLANIEGSVSGITKNNVFFVGVKIERNSRYIYNYMPCTIPKPEKKQTNFEIPCVFTGNEFDDIYLLQYYFPNFDQEPFEVIIKDELKGIDDEDIPKFRSSNTLYSINIYLLILFGLLSL